MRYLLISILLLQLISLQAQNTNPWENNKTNYNPWLTEAERKEQEEQKKLQEIKRMKELAKQDSMIRANNSLKTDSVFYTYKKENTDSLILKYKNHNQSLYTLGMDDASNYYKTNGMGAGGFFLTLIPIIGNPIVWIYAMTKPTINDVATTDNPRNEFLKK